MSAIRGDAADDDLSDETRMLAAAARDRASCAPGPAELADLLSAPRVRHGVTEEEFRKLGRLALAQSQQLSYLLGKLAALTGGGPGGEAHVKG